MAGRLPSFASGSNLAIYIGESLVAYGSNLSFVDDVAHAAIGGIGSFSYDALEPTQYTARGNFSLSRYSDVSHSALTGQADPKAAMPGRSAAGNADKDGNSLLDPSQFNPSHLIASQTFDIKIFERLNNGTVGDLLYTLENCRMTGYSIGFSPGSIVSENISFMCILVNDTTVG